MDIDLKDLSLEDLNDLINKATLEKKKKSYIKDSIGIDCFQPKSDYKSQHNSDEEIAKVFQFGMAFGFIESLNANKNDIPLDKLKRIYIGMDGKAVQVYPNNDVLDNLRAELEDYITHSPYIDGVTNCCRLRDDVMRIVDKYKKVRDKN